MLSRTLSTIGLWLFVIIALLVFQTSAGVWIISILSFFTLWELFLLLENMGYQPYKRAGLISGLVIILGSYYIPIWSGMTQMEVGSELLALTTFALCLSIMTPQGFSTKMRTLIPTLFGILYIPFMMHFFVLIALGFDSGDHMDQSGLFLVLWLIITAKFTDVGGLLIGKSFGKKKLAPSISPGKTLEGTAGGIVVASLCGTIFLLIFRNQFPPHFTILSSLVLGPIIAVVAVISDLVESAIKRRANVKDSGSIIPGIGGAFDLSDSLILTAPVGYILFKYTVF